MSTQFEYRSTYAYPADEVWATMVNPDFLRARLEQIGGPGAALLEHSADTGGARYRLRHGVDAKALPSLVRNVLPGEFVIERSESWKREAPGSYTGEELVAVPGTPGSATGEIRLSDTDEGSEQRIRVELTVNVPIIGGTIEEMVVGQVKALLESESAFTRQWLASGH